MSLDKKADTILKHYLKAVDTFGLPSRVRFDHGSEGVLVGEFQTAFQAELTGSWERGSFLTGRSVHNTRIEMMWNFLSRSGMGTFRKLFDELERAGLLNVDDSGHLFVLHSVFLPRIQGTVQNLNFTGFLFSRSSVKNSEPCVNHVSLLLFLSCARRVRAHVGQPQHQRKHRRPAERDVHAPEAYG